MAACLKAVKDTTRTRAQETLRKDGKECRLIKTKARPLTLKRLSLSQEVRNLTRKFKAPIYHEGEPIRHLFMSRQEYLDYVEDEKDMIEEFKYRFSRTERLVMYFHYRRGWGRRKIRARVGIPERVFVITMRKLTESDGKEPENAEKVFGEIGFFDTAS